MKNSIIRTHIKKIANYLRKIKYATSFSFEIIGYNFRLIKKINHYLSARKHILHNGIVMSITKGIFVSHSFRPVRSSDVKNEKQTTSKESDCAIIRVLL